MDDKSNAKMELPPVTQIGILVKDAAKTMDYYSSTFGIGPFRSYDVDIPEGATYRGKPASGRLRIAIAKMGAIEIEFIQVLEGGEFYAKHLEEKGEGLHHLGVHIEDADKYDKVLNVLADQGVDPTFSVKGPGVSCAYVETPGGLILEPIYMKRRG